MTYDSKKLHSSMKTILCRLSLPLICSLLLAACSVQRERLPTTALFDLGPVQTTQALPVVAISVADVTPSAWLDSPLMFYRLNFDNNQQPRAYAQHRWAMPPLQIFGQRLKSRIAQTGGIAASAVEGPTNLALLRMEADDFTHVFETPGQSHGFISLRASAYHGRTLIAHKSFIARAPAPSNDAEGGARALAQASDLMINDIVGWLSTLPLKRPSPP